MQELLIQFEKSFEDHLLTRNERKAISLSLGESDLSHHDKNRVRAWLFDQSKKWIREHPPILVMEWLEEALKLLMRTESQPKNSSTVSKAYFSPGESPRQAILDFIRNSRKYLDVCVFTISDNVVSKALVDAHKRGVRVRILSDDDKRWDRGSDIDTLHQAGIEVRLDNTSAHMHHKFALSDRSILLNGSYNWTRSAMTHNNENLTLTREASLVSRFIEHFDELWKTMSVCS